MRLTIYVLISLFALSSCSQGYYSHLPRAETYTVTKELEKTPKQVIEVRLLEADLLADSIEITTLIQLVESKPIKETHSLIRPELEYNIPRDSSKDYIKGDPEKGLKANTFSKILTPFAILFSIWLGAATVEFLGIGIIGEILFGLAFTTGLLMLLLTLLVYSYQKKFPLFNRPSHKSKKITLLRVIMILAALLILFVSIIGTITFIETIIIMSGPEVLSIPLGAMGLLFLLTSTFLWLKMFWKEFAY